MTTAKTLVVPMRVLPTWPDLVQTPISTTCIYFRLSACSFSWLSAFFFGFLLFSWLAACSIL